MAGAKAEDLPEADDDDENLSLVTKTRSTESSSSSSGKEFTDTGSSSPRSKRPIRRNLLNKPESRLLNNQI